ncbi:beta-ketoacyl synthase chain length factor [Herminiimonas fonticola]|uniref:Beta-ketoacyl synthase-like protein n=1 Tax=Herminiimonas fonticola TaxID=303380 RepID=A0A4R6GID9_9BURK|nr:beta-ketoacyl synthase chain length factor [Herminiimonas fonticola]RBA25055.1 Beta-ketoacyl synthase, N-terminal domain [Herminiimonas fonticola]TDN94170.1 beta-ketoacyl synthase-like protein [Herminiimonas fonticola]
MSVHVYIDAIGAIGPGANNWTEWRAILQNDAAYQAVKTVVPVLNVLPSAERRRVGSAVKLALVSGLEALAAASIDPRSMTTVFSSSGGDGDNCHLICEALASEDRLISPTRFHNSVHNAPSGYWGIASGAMLPSTSVCAYDAGFAAGLLEAVVQCSVEKKPVLLVAYDAPYPEPLYAARPTMDQFAISLLLSPDVTAHSMVGIDVCLDKALPTVMHASTLESVRLGIPAARCLPMMQVLARLPDMHSGTEPASDVYLEYLNGNTLHVKFLPVKA